MRTLPQQIAAHVMALLAEGQRQGVDMITNNAIETCIAGVLEAKDRCLAKVREDEPIFVLRGQDSTAVETIESWQEHVAERCEKHGRKIPNAKLDAADADILRFKQYYAANPTLVKIPD